jgi:hypothetical protein
MESHFIKCKRELDGRTIYIQSDCMSTVWVKVIDTLIDSQFVISKISEKRFKALQEKSSKWCYVITDKSSGNFIHFIEDNYDKTLQIVNKQKSLN